MPSTTDLVEGLINGKVPFPSERFLPSKPGYVTTKEHGELLNYTLQIAIELRSVCNDVRSRAHVNSTMKKINRFLKKTQGGKSVPDKPGFWWWREKGKIRWELTEAREITPGKINLYSMEKTWGGYTHEEAEKSLPGDWLFVSRPDETQVDKILFVPTPRWVQEFLKKARQELDKTKEENNVR